jgi:5-methylcytosine-specific restriction endonuclease McrA
VGPEPKEFKDVTIYTPGNVIWPNIVRIDATRAKIWVGPYAQHRESVHVEFIRKGRRKAEALVSSSKPYVVVVPTTHAIQPDDLYLPAIGGVSTTRYGVADPRWRTDFDEQLRLANVPIVADYRNLCSDAETESASILGAEVIGNQLPALSEEPTKDTKCEGADVEYEEGLRHQAERNFFQRNPRLVQQAKEVYGCACQVCGFDFAKTYGALGQDFAEVHHLNPLSERPAEEWIAAVQTSIADVAVLCANCHRVIHRRKPALSVEELKAMVAAGCGCSVISRP